MFPFLLIGVIGIMALAAKQHPRALIIASDLITKEEGFSPTKYKDAGGWSIGYGHFILPNEAHLMTATLTKAQAVEYLISDMAKANSAVNKAVKVALSDNERAACISLAYNIGVNGFAGSTLVKKLNAGDKAGAAAEFARWNKSQGQVLKALVDRRSHEAKLFLTA